MTPKGLPPSTSAVDLFAPTNRFVSASKIYGRLHRWSLLLRQYWWLFFLGPLCIVGPIYAYLTVTGPTYTSKGRMWLTGKIQLSGDRLYTEELVNFLGTQSALIKSPAITRRAWARFNAESLNEGGTGNGVGAAGENAGGHANIRGSNRPPSHINTAKALIREIQSFMPASETNSALPIPFDVTVEEGSRSSTLELKVTGKDPVATRRFLDILMDEYLNFKRESVHRASSHATSSLNTEAAELQGKLQSAQTSLQTYRASNDVVFLHSQGSSAENYLATLNRQLAVVKTELNLLDSIQTEQWAQTDAIRRGITADPGSNDDSVARQALNSLSDSQSALFRADQQMHLLMAKRKELSEFLRPEHPKIIKLDQEIATQQELVRVSRNEATKQFTLRREALKSQLKNLEAATKEWREKAVDSSRKMADYEQIKQDVQRIEAAYDRTLNLIQTIDVGNRVAQADVGILDFASVAKPTHRTLKYMAAAIVLSFGLCFGLLYCISVLKDGFFSHEEMGDQLGEQVVGFIPEVPSRAVRKSMVTAGLERQRFEFQEAFRNIRASLLFMGNGERNAQAVAISSSVPDEGKSTVSLYLAVTLARANCRVLLVDGDLRRPTLHRRFKLPPGPGLAALLSNEISSGDVVFESGIPNLALLPAGEASQHPGDLVLSPTWPDFLEAARHEYDYILVDTPPLAATDDAVALANKMDGVLFVVRAESTSARVARDALNLLRLRQIHIIGLVLNRVKSTPYEPQHYREYAEEYHWEPAHNGGNAGRLLSSRGGKGSAKDQSHRLQRNV
jgi:succinoglycan biosynthesis transport protein ExoP